MKKIIKSILQRFGYDIIRYIPLNSMSAQLRKIYQEHSFDIVLDVGANVGNYARDLRILGFNGKIVLFEPQSGTYGHLKKLAQKDRGIILAPQTAIGEAEGEVLLNISANSESSSILAMLETHLDAAPESKYICSEKVRVQRLDQVAIPYIDKPNSSLYVKIDTQGYEREVINGMSGILDHVKGIQVELSLMPLYEGQLLYQDMIALIESFGFELYAILPNFVDNVSGRTYQVDGVFLRPE